MRILVFIKQVPDTGTHIHLKNTGEGIEESGVEWIINPYDEFALSASLQIKEQTEGIEVVVLSLGPLRVEKALRQALAIGADRAYLIEHEDKTWPAKTARTLAHTIQQEEPNWDLILCGKVGVDENHSAVGPMTAELLNVPHLSSVTKLSSSRTHGAEKEKNLWLCERNREEGLKEEITLKLPAVITVDKGTYQPRYPTLPGIMKAKKKEIKTIKFSGPHNTSESLYFKSYRLPAPSPPPRFITGTAEEQAQGLVQTLKEKQLF